MLKNTTKSLINKCIKWVKQTNYQFTSNSHILETGDFEVEVLGTYYNQKLLKSLSKNKKDILVTLTPINDYQIKNKWPTPPFVNINLYGSKKTGKDNWLGFVPIDDPRDIDFIELLDRYKNVDAHAEIFKSNNEYGLLLHISDKYKYDNKKIIKYYVQHDKEQIKYLEKIAPDLGDFIYVTIKKSPDNKHFNYFYNSKMVGSSSLKDIDNLFENNLIRKTAIKITKFRFNDPEDNKHYSETIVLKK